MKKQDILVSVALGMVLMTVNVGLYQSIYCSNASEFVTETEESTEIVIENADEEQYKEYVFVSSDENKKFKAKLKHSATTRILVTYSIEDNQWIDVTENGLLLWYNNGSVSVYRDRWKVEECMIKG